MSGVLVIFVLFGVIGFVLAIIAFLAYRRILRRAKGIERGLKMVPLLIHLPPPGDASDQNASRDVREVMREKVSQAQVLYDLVAGTAQAGFKSNFYGQRHIAFELIASNGLIHFFAAVPVPLVSTVEQAILTAYPGARIEEVEDHNIFNPQGKLTGTVGGELVLKNEAVYPIGDLQQMERDPIEGLLNALTKLQLGDGAAVQIMLRPANPGWTKRGKSIVARKRHQKHGSMSISAMDLAKAAVKAPGSSDASSEAHKYQPSKLEESILESIENKMRHPGFEILIRVVASSNSYDRSQMVLRNVINAFSLYEAPGSNGFKFLEARDMQGLITAFIFRFFPPEVSSNVLSTPELAALFHLPDAQFNSTTAVERQQSKQVDGPVHMPTSGLLLGYNFYRGVKKEVRLSQEDRRRHMYIVGQTGTGKSTILENLAVQDMLAGNGFAFIDPHGDTAEKLISMIPKERAEDVVYFNPADTEHPLGLNLFEFDTPEQKDFVVQEAINMLYKLYDPEHSGIIGPRFEHWFRNAALTLMADPGGSSFIELPKVFTDTEYLKNKFKYLNDPTVIDFWTKEMGQTSDYHKSEMLGWFVSKFGAFQSNEMMRNIIGQTESAFNIREIMDQKKILIVNLSKGLTGELNSKLLGMLFVIKIQAAAMSRSNITEAERTDFCLYVDEFQNFSTDSFASILSEARKYRLNLIVANQFIGQLSEEIREAVFGNIGTVMSYRTGPDDAEFLVKQFQPIFSQHDLINIPNHNAVMKLLIGGLPSQPFSITALPPLGQEHPEMGIAIKQLSAAKFGVPRAAVEADIFARLQNKPRIPIASVRSTPSPAAPPVQSPVAAPAVTAPNPAAPPTTSTSPPATAIPALQPPPQPVTPVVSPAPVSAPATTPAPHDPAALSLQQLRDQAPSPAVNADHVAQTATPNTAKVSDVVGIVSPPTPPVALIEEHESDGQPDPDVTVRAGVPVDPTKPAPSSEVEAKEAVTPPASPPPSPQQVQPAPVVSTPPPIAPTTPPSVRPPVPRSSPAPSLPTPASTAPKPSVSAVTPVPVQPPTPVVVSPAPVPVVAPPPLPAATSAPQATPLAEEVQGELNAALANLPTAATANEPPPTAASPVPMSPSGTPDLSQLAENINDQLEEKVHPHPAPTPVVTPPPKIEPAPSPQPPPSQPTRPAPPPTPTPVVVPPAPVAPTPPSVPTPIPTPPPQSASPPVTPAATSDAAQTPAPTSRKRKRSRSRSKPQVASQTPTPQDATAGPSTSQPQPESASASGKRMIATHRGHHRLGDRDARKTEERTLTHKQPAESSPEATAEPTPPTPGAVVNPVPEPAPVMTPAPVVDPSAAPDQQFDASMTPGEIRIDENGEVVSGPSSGLGASAPSLNITAAGGPDSSADGASSPAKPDVKPGEIFVDENGNVIQG
jgi:hypothetical protein